MPRIKAESTDNPLPGPVPAKATRIRLTKDQTNILRTAFEQKESPEFTKAHLLELSAQTGLTTKWISTWFSRQKYVERKKRKEVEILNFKAEYVDSVVPASVKASVASESRSHPAIKEEPADAEVEPRRAMWPQDQKAPSLVPAFRPAQFASHAPLILEPYGTSSGLIYSDRTMLYPAPSPSFTSSNRRPKPCVYPPKLLTTSNPNLGHHGAQDHLRKTLHPHLTVLTSFSSNAAVAQDQRLPIRPIMTANERPDILPFPGPIGAVPALQNSTQTSQDPRNTPRVNIPNNENTFSERLNAGILRPCSPNLKYPDLPPATPLPLISIAQRHVPIASTQHNYLPHQPPAALFNCPSHVNPVTGAAATTSPSINTQQELFDALSTYFMRYGHNLQDPDSFSAAVELVSLVRAGLLL